MVEDEDRGSRLRVGGEQGSEWGLDSMYGKVEVEERGGYFGCSCSND